MKMTCSHTTVAERDAETLDSNPWHRQGDLQTLTIPATLFLSTDTNS